MAPKKPADPNEILEKMLSFAERYTQDLDMRLSAGDTVSPAEMRTVSRLLPTINTIRRDEAKIGDALANASPSQIADEICVQLGPEVLCTAIVGAIGVDAAVAMIRRCSK